MDLVCSRSVMAFGELTLTELPSNSGAFSNVYKARDRRTGQKVAIKVVRKYELNSNQVSFCTRTCMDCAREIRRRRRQPIYPASTSDWWAWRKISALHIVV